MAITELQLRLDAIDRYNQSARRAELSDYWARFTGKSCSLLKYDEVANRLHLRQQIPLGHQMVPLHKIVGSVGRFREFTRAFMPRRTILQDRWVAVDVTMNSLSGLPPVDLYKIGDAYFVVDGNHRISVARANGSQDIEAKVVEWQTNLHYTVQDFTSDTWLLKAAYNDFLSETKLTALRPGAELPVSKAEHYAALLQQIAVHRYLSNQPVPHPFWLSPEMTWREAVVSWYDTVYLPVAGAIRAHRLQVRFPKLTETDLYIFITQYREQIAEAYELAPLGVETAVRVFAANHSGRTGDRLRLAFRRHVESTLQWVNKQKWPAGMTEEEFCALRLRHDAGELSVGEARRRSRQVVHIAETLCEGTLGVQLS